MNRRLWILLAFAVYLLLVLGWQRLKRARARRGLPPARMAPFDHEALLGELRELYEAGLPGDGEPAAGSPKQERAGPLASELGLPVAWLRPDRWEASPLTDVPEQVRKARDRVLAGHDAQVGDLVEPSQEGRIDQLLTSLGIHAFLSRLYAGDLDGARRVLVHLPGWSNGRLSPKVVDKYLAQLAFLRAVEARAKGDRSQWKHASEARRRLREAGATEAFAEPGTVALWAHLTLVFFRHALNQEFLEVRVDRRLRRTLAEHRNDAILYYELAHVSSWRGRPEEAVDHLARALYFAQGRRFYARPILESPEVARLKPGLVQQVRGRFDAT